MLIERRCQGEKQTRWNGRNDLLPLLGLNKESGHQWLKSGMRSIETTRSSLSVSQHIWSKGWWENVHVVVQESKVGRFSSYDHTRSSSIHSSSLQTDAH